MIYIASGHIGAEYALDHPRFAFHKWAASYAASSTAAGADVAWLGDGETWSQWRAGSQNATVTLTYSEARAVSYVGIAAHDLDLAGSTITLQVNAGEGFANVPGLVDLPVADDSAILLLLAPIDVLGVRIVISGSNAATIGVLQAGISMELPRRCTYTALPISESDQTTYQHTQSIKGNILGTSVEAAELSFGISVSHLSEDWRAASGVASWKALTVHVRNGDPLFVASRPSGYADDVAYGVAAERPRFNRAIPNRNISGQFELQFLGYKRP